MKVLAINGSPRAEGNTFYALKKVCGTLAEMDVETELLQIGDKQIRGCIACYACAKSGECALADDDFRAYTQKMYDADALIIGSPVYYAAIAGTLKCFLDRAFFQSGGRMKNKIGAGIAICRRSGGMTTFEQLNAYFQISEMVTAPSFYWNIGHGALPGEVENDAEAMSTFELLGKNIGWLLKMKEATRDTVPLPAVAQRERMNFIR